MRTLFFIFLFLFQINLSKSECFKYEANTLSEVTAQICDSIVSKASKVEGKYLGTGGSLSRIYPFFEKLKAKSTFSELVSLTSHPNPILRCYAFKALSEIESTPVSALTAIIHAHLCDLQIVETHSGSIMIKTTVGDFIHGQMKSKLFNRLTMKDRTEVDSLLFWGQGNAINARKEAVKSIDVDMSNYLRLKELLLKEDVPEALLPLLSIGNDDDMLLVSNMIDSHPEEAFEAIAKFPRNTFREELRVWPEKQTSLYDDSWLCFYQAVIAYRDTFSLSIIKSLLDLASAEEKKEHAENIYYCLRNNKNKIFDTLKVSLVNYMSNFDLSFFNDLVKIDEKKTLKIVKQRLISESHPFWKEDLVNKMADKIIIAEKKNGVNVINKVLEAGYSTTYKVFSARAKQNFNKETIEVYKKRFTEAVDENEWSLDHIIQGIIIFENPALYREIEEKAFYYAGLDKFKHSVDLQKLLVVINKKRAELLGQSF